MLLQTNSYIVPKDKRSEHARLLRKFRQTLQRLGCDHFEVYEQVGSNWAGGESTGRFVQIMRFRDRKHQQRIQAAEKQDPQAQQLISEFCALINFPYQQQQGLFAVGFYNSALPIGSARRAAAAPAADAPPAAGFAADAAAAAGRSVPEAEPASRAPATEDAATTAVMPQPPPLPEARQADGASLLDFAALDPSGVPAAAAAAAAAALTSDAEPLDLRESAPPAADGVQPDSPEALLELVPDDAELLADADFDVDADPGASDAPDARDATPRPDAETDADADATPRAR